MNEDMSLLNDIPMGFGMALAKNVNAMKYFAGLPRERQAEIVRQTHEISSKQEMQAFVERMMQDGGSSGSVTG